LIDISRRDLHYWGAQSVQPKVKPLSDLDSPRTARVRP
jgi:hypothetical protein